jgi:hypothetical protein
MASLLAFLVSAHTVSETLKECQALAEVSITSFSLGRE